MRGRDLRVQPVLLPVLVNLTKTRQARFPICAPEHLFLRMNAIFLPFPMVPCGTPCYGKQSLQLPRKMPEKQKRRKMSLLKRNSSGTTVVLGLALPRCPEEAGVNPLRRKISLGRVSRRTEQVQGHSTCLE